MRRVTLTLLGCFLLAACSVVRPAPSSPVSPDSPTRVASNPDKIYYFVDGLTASREAVERIPKDSVQRITILKGSPAVERYGPDALAGAMLIVTRHGEATAEVQQPSDRNGRIFFFIDGRTATRDEVERFPRERIHHILILKGPAAVARYGPEAEAGAMLVSTTRSS